VDISTGKQEGSGGVLGSTIGAAVLLAGALGLLALRRMCGCGSTGSRR
jgi:hypothetical protein